MRCALRIMFFSVVLGIILFCMSVFFIFDKISIDARQQPLTLSEKSCEFISREITIHLRMADDIIEMNLEEYVCGVVMAEMPSDFAMEALKAQAVASRSFALYSMENGGKHKDGSLCTDPSCCQAFVSLHEHADNQSAIKKIETAVKETEGEVLFYNDNLIESVFFSCSGGKTEDAVEVWGTDLPYLRSVDSPGENESPYFIKEIVFSQKELEEKTGCSLLGSADEWFQELDYSSGGSVCSALIGGKSYSGREIRTMLGLPSAWFSVEPMEGHVRITTRGYGHRVGMSQYGADVMALRGKSYREILEHYYQGTDLRKYN